MREAKKVPKGVSRVEKQRLSLQKSAPLIVPKKWPITVKGRGGRLDEADEQSQYCRMKAVAHKVRLLGKGRPEAASRYQKCLGSIEGEHQGQDLPKRRMPKTARAVLWEDGG